MMSVIRFLKIWVGGVILIVLLICGVGRAMAGAP